MIYIYYENPVFTELAKSLLWVCQQKHLSVQITNTIKDNNFLDLYIIFGMNDFNSPVVPNNYIVFQLEQTTGDDQSNWFKSTYINYLKGALAVWDYSLVNYKHLKQMGVGVGVGVGELKYVPLQYMEPLDTITQQAWVDKDIDVFFYGSMNDRRQKILDELKTTGLRTEVRTNVWSTERSQLIARSKIILNLHYYDRSILETARLSYLLSNQCTVVSELSDDPILDKWHQSYASLVETNKIVETCLQLSKTQKPFPTQDYQRTSWYGVLAPILDQIKTKYDYLLVADKTGAGVVEAKAEAIEVAPTSANDIFEAETKITKENYLVLNLPQLSHQELPFISIVTITYNRRTVFPIAIRNWELFDYPKDKLEWVIIDDSDDGSSLSGLLPKTSNVKYYKLTTTGRLSIGQKRNFGVEKASHDIIAFMDDDDYYYPCSIRARAALLIKYPQYDVVGVTNLDIYDVVNDFSARVAGAHVSEASMAFHKRFWLERKFPEKFSSLGEGYPFLKGRRNRVVKMPSCFNILAMTHWSNYTQNNRSFQKFQNVGKKDNLLTTLDFKTQLFISELFDKMRRKEGKKSK